MNADAAAAHLRTVVAFLVSDRNTVWGPRTRGQLAATVPAMERWIDGLMAAETLAAAQVVRMPDGLPEEWRLVWDVRRAEIARAQLAAIGGELPAPGLKGDPRGLLANALRAADSADARLAASIAKYGGLL